MSESTTPQRSKNGALIRRFLPYMVKYRGVLAFDLFCAALTGHFTERVFRELEAEAELGRIEGELKQKLLELRG